MVELQLTRKLQYLFINKMRTRPIVNQMYSNYIYIMHRILHCAITIRAQQIMNEEQIDSQSESFLL